MRTLPPLAVMILALVLVACDEDDAAPPPAPDQVVGIELKCDIVFTRDTNDPAVITLTGWDTCDHWADSLTAHKSIYGEGNLRKELTIRTGSGEIYRVSYGAEHEVNLGDVWPPR